MSSHTLNTINLESTIDWTHPAAQTFVIIDAKTGFVQAERPRSKVALVGYVSQTRDKAPYDDPEWEIWGENQLYRFIPRADRWFEIHKDWNAAVIPGTDYHRWLKEAPIPVYMWDVIPSIPHSIRFPVEQYLQEFSDYRTSTIAYMLGLAILEGFTTIGLWGIELAIGSEYFYQGSCLEYLIGVARGRGIECFCQKVVRCARKPMHMVRRQNRKVSPSQLMSFVPVLQSTQKLVMRRLIRFVCMKRP